ncbi:class I SAM-dependent methyltransferase [Paenibacillus sp. 1001270B_150601_E10]|uniref:class I SAM-dependent methyltransferase n=1 Tax=Paenibacillus sp. 1001270B_150601_E10 TaxID=2787079 RepID=UPI00189E5036|nr:class I SAM-dependent methyltransferase [Paenibacillus sp. 1001270B_150601_E10]
MAIIQAASTNPKFSYMIRKNPSNGMILRDIRKGIAYGWYSDANTYNIYFKDADNDISYKRDADEAFEYLNVSRYNTPLFPLNAINEFLSASLKAQSDEDIAGYKHSIYINMIHVEKLQYIHFFIKHFSDYDFELEHREDKSYALRVSTHKSLYELLHVISVLCLFLSMFGREYIDVSDSIIEKYIKSVQVIDAPYYIRSLFARNFLNSRERHRKYKGMLEETQRYSLQLDYGGTATQRRNTISRMLPFNKSILDVGCGEGFYAIPYAGKVEGHYYAVDINEELLRVVERKASAKDLDHLITYASIEQFVDTYNGEQVDVILTEVIEHMSKDEAARLVQSICHNIDFEYFIITTPNADFNAFYEITAYRHLDHRWEMGEKEFQSWFSQVLSSEWFDYEYLAIGDKVNGIATTQGVVIRKRGEQGGDRH